ncbi:2-oxoadipate dioxygenase/decarboxylase HglS [Donghicola tyrosinivorans]|uniref:2-oxoadipate dioxygenase/decarboxylase n=1 Tax=Donghicola tyrosinivorans TaxID=1652492 RepID=A0A2T0WYD9_9RHOB|nr:VOC family protein [Donghicola tyrosinivorans]PRY91712.1 putative glyoxalase superfamily metalloenzyme YdcJ [Donghicola tyrosinivorans]
MTQFAHPDDIRSRFSAAMSAMYRTEVPAYGTLMQIVSDVNDGVLAANAQLRSDLEQTDQLSRISEERHGAIRLGTPQELATMRRLFAVMGMQPVGYYDLTEASVPVHSTAFRPVGEDALRRNPFRVFTSLLRLDLISDAALRDTAAKVLAERQIYTPRCLELIDLAESQGGLTEAQADEFVAEALETFRWHPEANVSADLYQRLHDAHRLVADVVSFKGPHINHLTPRTLDIDRVQELMPEHGIDPKAVIEGPPRRAFPILLRQTSFKALSEAVSFDGKDGSHTARFGEIEARGQALTPVGRALYDALLTKTREKVRPAADGSNTDAYMAALQETFTAFPDTLEGIREDSLGYFEWSLTDKGRANAGQIAGLDAEQLLAQGYVRIDPIVYEDFLPVSAAGIFQSNLGDDDAQEFAASPNQQRFETDLGAKVLNEFDHYQQIEDASRAACVAALTKGAAAE